MIIQLILTKLSLRPVISSAKMLSLIKASGSDSLKFVDDLLNRESQLKELQKEPVNLYTLLTYCVNLLEYKANEKNQKIILNGSYILINVNREKIWRVFSNLITNAIKFSPPKTTIRVNLEITLDNVFVSIKDQGIGIPEEMKKDIFNISVDTKRLGTSGEQTFGMGLIISKQIIEAHGGKIWLESEPSKGTIFFVELPIQ
jgi:signal transduction histidine kinase